MLIAYLETGNYFGVERKVGLSTEALPPPSSSAS
jgi:hypothetical protein